MFVLTSIYSNSPSIFLTPLSSSPKSLSPFPPINPFTSTVFDNPFVSSLFTAINFRCFVKEFCFETLTNLFYSAIRNSINRN
jgi:hypothetical protein